MQGPKRSRASAGEADKSTEFFNKRYKRFDSVMFSMENLDLDVGMNRHNVIFEAPGFAATIPPVSTSAVRSSPGSGDSSTNSIDLFLYEESDEVSDESLYESDQENRERSGSCKQFKSHRRRPKCLQHQIQQRQAANMRERRRMQSINDAFEGLRAHIPTLPYEKRLSKVDTLKLAIGYINFLGELVRNDKSAKESAASGTARTQKREEPKKIIVKGGSSHAHSLSWSRRGEHPHGSTLFARVWTPQDPRAPNSSTPSDEPHVRTQ